MVPGTAAVWTHVSRCPHYANKHQNNIYILFHVCTQITFTLSHFSFRYILFLKKKIGLENLKIIK